MGLQGDPEGAEDSENEGTKLLNKYVNDFKELKINNFITTIIILTDNFQPGKLKKGRQFEL